MQSGTDAGEIWIWNQDGDLASASVHIILAGVNMPDKDINIKSQNTVILESKSGTENALNIHLKIKLL